MKDRHVVGKPTLRRVELGIETEHRLKALTQSQVIDLKNRLFGLFEEATPSVPEFRRVERLVTSIKTARRVFAAASALSFLQSSRASSADGGGGGGGRGLTLTHISLG
jgi:hypothetical protein